MLVVIEIMGGVLTNVYAPEGTNVILDDKDTDTKGYEDVPVEPLSALEFYSEAEPLTFGEKKRFGLAMIARDKQPYVLVGELVEIINTCPATRERFRKRYLESLKETV